MEDPKVTKKLTISFYVNPENITIFTLSLWKVKVGVLFSVLLVGGYIFWGDREWSENQLIGVKSNKAAIDENKNISERVSLNRGSVIPVEEISVTSPEESVATPETSVATPENINLEVKSANPVTLALGKKTPTLEDSQHFEAMNTVAVNRIGLKKSVNQMALRVELKNLSDTFIEGKVWAVARYKDGSMNGFDIASDSNIDLSNAADIKNSSYGIYYKAKKRSFKSFTFKSNDQSRPYKIDVYVSDKLTSRVKKTEISAM